MLQNKITKDYETSFLTTVVVRALLVSLYWTKRTSNTAILSFFFSNLSILPNFGIKRRSKNAKLSNPALNRRFCEHESMGNLRKL